MRRPGFGLAETLLAGMLLSMVAASFLAINSALNINTRISYQTAVAAQLAQKAVADLHYQVEANWRASRDPNQNVTNWDTGLPAACDGSPFNINGLDYDCSYIYEDVATGIKVRQAGSLNTPTGLVRRVRVTVDWQDGLQSRNYTLRTMLTNWRPAML